MGVEPPRPVSQARRVTSPAPSCRGCRFHYITYEEEWPYGCRAFEFKSRRLPSLVVLESSGEPCRAFEARSSEPGGRPNGVKEER